MIFRLFNYLILFLLVSCIGLFEKEKTAQQYEYSEKDYLSHLSYLEDVYLNNNKKKITKIDGKDLEYFKAIINKLIVNNEFILKKNELKTQLYIVDDPQVFHFSLPGPHIFVSSALISKYIKSEKILIAILAFDIVKSLNNLYYKKILVPVGDVSINVLLRITQLNSEYNKEVSKWTYVVLKRSGNDPVAFLNWLQIQNKNPSDFRIMFEDQRFIYEMETNYKSFLVDKEKNTKLSDETGYNSSKGFYSLLDRIKRRKI